VSCEEFTRALGIATGKRGLPHVMGMRVDWSELAAHGRDCEDCRRLWEVDRLLRLGGHKPAPRMAMSMELRAALAADRHEPPARVFGTSRRLSWIVVPTLLSLAAGFTAFARVDLHNDLPSALWWGAVAPFALMGLLVQLLMHRNREGFGLSIRTRWLVVGGTVLALWTIGGTAALHAAPDPALATPQDCAFLGFAVALAVGAGAMFAMRGRVLTGSRSAGALCAAIGGAAAAAFLQLHCTASASLHVQVVHLLPLLWALPIGMFAGRRVLAA